ncbi:DUF2157 domain-containing protein [Mitsuaria sp. GD03876]|uniref:DUF2157 domain-containing protein n=1 Tax=Mitsuaria sp. GD03876 TaxID=2975399 RepID=UPI00244BEA8E|nr:DUF2157 domain-containing protein [Mitsuaria sp. GD03876]MDH0865660.1 DUF2157 domain-containing protein [Mitsuaria sp. GD03876]
MSLHERLYQWTASQGLDASSARRLRALSGVDDPPADAWTPLRRGAGTLAAGLIGFGLILWVAANWDDFGRALRFGLLEAVLAVALVAAALLAAWRAPLALAGFLTLGGLLAYFGQTYQTGADTYQLFALWAALGLPVAWAARSDLVWTPWAVVVATAIGLWMETFGGHAWRFDATTVPVHALGFVAYGALCVGMGARPGARAQPWAWRVAVLASVIAISGTGLGALFARHVAPQFYLALGVMGVGLVLAWRHAEVYALSALALAVDTLLVAGLARVVIDARGDIGGAFLIGLVACGLLAVSVSLIMRRVRATEARA